MKIEQEDPDFEENKIKLDISLSKVENGTAECCSLDELDLIMDEIFSEYDNRIK